LPLQTGPERSTAPPGNDVLLPASRLQKAPNADKTIVVGERENFGHRGFAESLKNFAERLEHEEARLEDL
jgi:hypothetical protein